MPSHHVRASYERFAPHLRPGQLLVSATKGIEDQTYLRISEVIGDVLRPYNLGLSYGVLSGPSFAQEVAAGAPTAVTIASNDARSGGAGTEGVQQRDASGCIPMMTWWAWNWAARSRM